MDVAAIKAAVSLGISLAPLIVDLVTQVEQLFPAAGQGAAKLELVKSFLKSSMQMVPNLEQDFEAMWPSLQNLVSGVVNFCNSTGLFKKAAAAATPAS